MSEEITAGASSEETSLENDVEVAVENEKWNLKSWTLKAKE